MLNCVQLWRNGRRNRFQLGVAAVGGLAAISASNAQIGVDDISQRLGDSDGDISSLRAQVSNLGNTQSTFQDQLNVVRNGAVTPAQLAIVTETANSANNQVQDGIDEVRRRLRNNNRDISSLRSEISNLQGTLEEDGRQTIASLDVVRSRVEASEKKSDDICEKVHECMENSVAVADRLQTSSLFKFNLQSANQFAN